MPDCTLVRVSEHVWWFTPDGRSDRPSLGLVAGDEASLLVDAGASPAHTRAFRDEIAELGVAPLERAVLTHWHWDHHFGASALDVPIAAHRLTAAEIAREATLDWGDAALDARVQAGGEVAFIAYYLRIEWPDRSGLRIVEPQLVFGDEGLDVALGGVTCTVRRVGGDHAEDSCVIHVVEDGVLFLGDALGQRLHEPPGRTLTGTRAIADRIEDYGPNRAILGHYDHVMSPDELAAELALLRRCADAVERLGDGASALAQTEDEREVIAELLQGAR
jgi:glyoxylase-like metal-dependent hydrolase (beta-lactamase superfamily II)